MSVEFYEAVGLVVSLLVVIGLVSTIDTLEMKDRINGKPKKFQELDDVLQQSGDTSGR